LKVIERPGNTLSVVLRRAWDGEEYLQSMVKHSPGCATGAHVSLVCHITVEELRRLLTVTDTANGVGNRFMLVGVRRSKLLPEGGNLDFRQLDALAARVAEQVAKARNRGRMARDDDARSIWAEIYGELSEGRPGLAGAMLARAEAHVTRLSMIYAILDGDTAIRPPHLLAALALWQYVEQTIKHVFGDSLGDPIADEIDRLLRICPDGLTRTALRDHFSGHQSSNRIGRALALLLEYSRAHYVKQETGGHPAERWFTGARHREG
jgi:hypothetical protein